MTKEEVIAQCKEAFKGYAGSADFISVADLPNLPTFRNAVGGFVKVHVKEIDANSDGKITEQEIIDVMMKMFKKQDKNGDGKLTTDEIGG